MWEFFGFLPADCGEREEGREREGGRKEEKGREGGREGRKGEMKRGKERQQQSKARRLCAARLS